MTQVTRNNLNSRLLASIGIIISGIMSFINLSEYIKIKILNKTDGYPFGSEGPVSWYYGTADTYAMINLIFGILFIVSLLFSFWALYKRNVNTALIALIAPLFILIIHLII